MVKRNLVVGARGDGIHLPLDAPPVGGSTTSFAEMRSGEVATMGSMSEGRTTTASSSATSPRAPGTTASTSEPVHEAGEEPGDGQRRPRDRGSARCDRRRRQPGRRKRGWAPVREREVPLAGRALSERERPQTDFAISGSPRIGARGVDRPAERPVCGVSAAVVGPHHFEGSTVVDRLSADLAALQVRQARDRDDGGDRVAESGGVVRPGTLTK